MRRLKRRLNKGFLRLLNSIFETRARQQASLVDSALPASHFYPNSQAGVALDSLFRKYLSSSGWMNSRMQRRSVDREGFAVPWLTYPAIHYLESLNLSEALFVEFGGGASTPYFARRCRRVITVEADDDYLASLKGLNLQDVSFLELNPCNEEMVTLVAEKYKMAAEKDAAFEDATTICRALSSLSEISDVIRSADFLLIDGGPRHLYAELVAEHASPDAVVVVDNTDMPVLHELARVFPEDRYLRIPFAGLGPLNPYQWETSIFLPRESAWEKPQD